MSSTAPVVGILLAGGKSSRMGGGDKCMRPLGGRPILAHIIERLKPQVSDMILNANGEIGRFAPTPVMEKNVARIFVRHVLVNRDDVDAALAQ